MIRLRTAEPGDCALVWHWRNTPSARLASADTKPISWQRHVAWYAEQLQRHPSRVWIVVLPDERLVGYYRITAGEDAWWVSIAIDEAHRGNGYGSEILALGRRGRIGSYRAQVRADNAASIRALEKAGYTKVGESDGGVLVIYGWPQ